MAGDLDLERAVHDRRAALPPSAQEVMLAGLESSEDAKRMRAEQFESEQRVKKPRIVYSGEQLVDMVKGLSAVAPNPDLLSEMWEQCEGVRTAFMAQYVKYCEVLISFCCLVRRFLSSLLCTAANDYPPVQRESAARRRTGRS